MPKVPHGEFTQKAPYLLDGVVLVDPLTGQPYKAGVTVQQVEGGFDPTGLSTEEKQDLILAAIQDLTAAFQATGPEEVNVVDDQLPPVEGQATATRQDQILSALNTLSTLAVDAATFRDSGTQAVSLASSPLPVGAASAAKQDAILAALGSLTQTLAGTLDVAGTVSLDPDDITVSGNVAITNPSISVTPGATFPVSLAGMSTEAKQDAILTALGNVLTQLQMPQPITDNNGSITIDGNVGVSGAVQVEDNGKSLTVDGTVAATQSGNWSVSVSGPVTVTDGAGPLTVDGTAQILDSAGNTLASAATTPGASDRGLVVRNIPSGTQAVSGTVAATQSGTWNVTSTPANAATLTTGPTAISVGTTSVQLAASVAGRKSVLIQNMGNSTLFVSFAATAVATAPTFVIPANNGAEISRDTWTGVVTAIRASGSTTADAVVTVVS